MRRALIFVLATLLLAGCSQITIMCPDGKSSASWKGLNILGDTSVTCSTGPTGDTAAISGLNLLALAAALAPIIVPMVGAQMPKSSPTATPTPAN